MGSENVIIFNGPKYQRRQRPMTFCIAVYQRLRKNDCTGNPRSMLSGGVRYSYTDEYNFL
jgi:hypothetical protein